MQTKIKVVHQVLVIVLQMLPNPRLSFVNAASYNYQDQDVVLLLPKKTSMMTVVKPFDVGLWCTIAGSFIYTVSVVWLLERRISDQSSTEVFTHIWSRDTNISLSSFNIQNRLARIVISVWLLVVSVLMISYITNYSLMLNVRKVNVNEILASDGAIGYLKHHFSPSYQDWSENLKAYTTEEECAQALSQGPSRGGVGVILMNRLDALHFISRRPGYTYYDIPPEADTPRSLGVLDFMVWFIITGTASTLGLIKFICDLLSSWMHRLTGLSVILPPSDSGESTFFRPTASITGERRWMERGYQCKISPKVFLLMQALDGHVKRHISEMRRENRAATSSPFAEGNASPGDDDENYESI